MVKNPRKVLSVFSLIMINVIAVDSLRTLSFSAKLGTSLIFYYLLCSIAFFLPVALITAELATTWPKLGGIYIWVKEAFGERYGFLVAWFQWIYNVVWYPVALGFVATTAAYFINSELATNKIYILSVVLLIFWGGTLLNCFGMKTASFFSIISSFAGVIFPMTMISGLGIWWLLGDKPLAIQFNWDNFIPKVTSVHDLVLVTPILFGLMGLEMSAVHAQEVKNPTKDYPLAIKVSGIIIVFSLLFSSLSVALVVPTSEMNLISGVMQAFEKFFIVLDIIWLVPVMAVFLIIGIIGTISAWIIGPAKSLLAAAEDGILPKKLSSKNNFGAPTKILFLQAIIVSILSTSYYFMPSIETAYLILTELTTVLALFMYLLMFASAIKLRYKFPSLPRPYKIPGEKIGIWLIAGLGFIVTLSAILISYFPPSQIAIKKPIAYVTLLIIGTVIFCLPAFWFSKRKE